MLAEAYKMTSSFVVDVQGMKDCRSKQAHLRLTMTNIKKKNDP